MIQIYNLKELKTKALEDKVPIICDEGLDFLEKLLLENKAKSLLEIGTAIGYSAIALYLSAPNLKITSIERDNLMYEKALDNIKNFNLTDKIKLINNDALEVNLDEKFDVIFIDAAKAQYIKFFEKYKSLLNT
ncbi:MAG: methyltransferase domain-containing protein, partial [Acholeplasmataceae bacterium]|nr:methyltransferase domain-containing protein [Acholeplasmataceae bacterium]